MNLPTLITRVLGVLALVLTVGFFMLSGFGKACPEWVGNVLSGIVGALAGALVGGKDHSAATDPTTGGAN